jgi:signal transduction histidine kinase
MRQNGKISVARDLTLWLVLGYLLIAIPIAFVGYRKSVNRAEAELKAQAKALCAKLTGVLGEHVWNLDDGAIAAYFQNCPLPDDLVHIHVSTQYGDPIADLTVSSESRIEAHRQTIIHEGENIGSIEVAFSRVGIDAQRSHAAALTISLAALLVFATGLLSAMLIRTFLGASLHTLVGQLRTIAGGDYDARLPPHQYREVDNINSAVNEMAEQIAESTARLEGEIEERRQAERELQVMRVNLEAMVSRRTAQLREINEELLRENQRRKRVEQEILDISTREQQRIGQDLHDALGQQLAGVAFLAASLERNLASKGYAEAAMAQQVATLVRDAVSHTRAVAKGLSPVEVEADGLVIALQDIANKTQELFHIECRFAFSGEGRIHSNHVAMHLFHITQEAVHNAIQHGKATTIDIQLSADQRLGMLTIGDNGCGFTPPHETGDGRGMGLNTMAYRADMVGGKLEIHSDLGLGTTVTATFINNPVPDTAPSETTDN